MPLAIIYIQYQSIDKTLQRVDNAAHVPYQCLLISLLTQYMTFWGDKHPFSRPDWQQPLLNGW